MVDAANIIFFTFFSYGFMVMLIKVGAFDAGVGALIRKLKSKDHYAMPLIAIIFSFMGASFGIYEETYGFVPVVMSLGVALGYDPLYGAITVLGGMATGYAAASINPYTVAIAQTIGELPLFSGMAFRWCCYLCFMAFFLFYMYRYGRMVKADPKKSFVYGVEFPFLSNASSKELAEKDFTTRHKISLALCFSTVIIFAYGAIKYGWYFSELSAIFIVMMFVIGLVNKQSINDTCNAFVDISKNILFAAFVTCHSYRPAKRADNRYGLLLLLKRPQRNAQNRRGGSDVRLSDHAEPLYPFRQRTGCHINAAHDTARRFAEHQQADRSAGFPIRRRILQPFLAHGMRHALRRIRRPH